MELKKRKRLGSGTEPINHDSIVRRFWAALLGVEVQVDGQVPGFAAYYQKLSFEARVAATAYAESCWIKIERDHREPNECIASAIGALGLDPDWHMARSMDPDCQPDSAAFLRAAVDWIWSHDRCPTAKQVAGWIELQPNRPQDAPMLCDRLRHWPEGQRFPLIPDDAALRHGLSGAHWEWYEPGSRRGTEKLPEALSQNQPKATDANS